MLCRIKNHPCRKRLLPGALSPLVCTARHAFGAPVARLAIPLVMVSGTAPEAQAQPLQEAAACIVLDERSNAAAPARVVDGSARGAEVGAGLAPPGRASLKGWNGSHDCE